MLAARTALIDSQVRPNDVTDRRLIAAMAAIPRETFVPEAFHSVAYADAPVQTGPDRYLWRARDFSKLVHVAGVKPTDRVLDIAPGAGYSTAVLCRLAGSVVALEADDEAAKALAAKGWTNVEAIAGSLKAGAAAKGPFDVIFVNGAVGDVPPAWIDQLAEGGRLAVVVTVGAVRQARVYTRSGGKTAAIAPFETAAPVLPGFEKVEAFRL
jgi:protein-L-isoaspartate(D-aspartate) O-methyltransferase